MRDSSYYYTGELPIPLEDCNVFLPGWGFDGRVTELAANPRPWLTSADLLDPYLTNEKLLAFLEHAEVRSVVLAGWSMGAYLAIDFALANPEMIKALYLLAARNFWPTAEIEQIRREMAENPEAFLGSFYRKCFLGYREEYRRFTEVLEKEYLADHDLIELESGLSYLEDYPLAARADALAKLDIPVYVLHGGKDIIAPAGEVAEVPGAASQILRAAGHPLFLDDSCPLDWHHRKETIRRKFSRSAATYDDHATVQREAAGRLAEKLPATTPLTILETGCGTGTLTLLLRDRYPESRITSIDFAEQMLFRARQKLAGDQKSHFVMTDAENYLRETDRSFDLVTSNSTMQWFDDLAGAFTRIREILNEDGSLVCTIFGPDTMLELQNALAAIHGRQLILPSAGFPTKEELSSGLEDIFSKVEVEEWELERSYSSLSALLKHIRLTGTAGWHPGQPLLSRRNLRELEEWFQENYGGCKITYQVFMVNCRK